MSLQSTKSLDWNEELLADPHAVEDKRLRVQRMFAAIAPSYDLNNRLHSIWSDQRWRRKAVALANVKPSDTVVDIACGTGDLALAFTQAMGGMDNRTTKIVGIDFTYEMLPIARHKSVGTRIRYLQGDAQHLPLADGVADVASIAFGIRNVACPGTVMSESYRILRRGGRMIILEFSMPVNRVLRALYNFYFRRILPRTATWISRDRTGAYRYLPESVSTFISRQTMKKMLEERGFVEVEDFPMTAGICVGYRAVKP